jgi:hypothetical protein
MDRSPPRPPARSALRGAVLNCSSRCGGARAVWTVFNISFTAFMNMCEHNHMVSKRVPPGEFETIWAIVNAKDKALTADEDKHNRSSSLNRQEFLQCIVRAATTIYITRGNVGDVSDAVERLCCENLQACMQQRAPAALQSSNAFRARFCYIELTSVVLEANLGSLRALYDNYAEVSHAQGDALRDDALMSIGEWLHFCRHMGLIASKQLTLTQCKSIFLWSRIRSVSGVSDKAEIRLRHLFFEDFLEALVRMSTLMAFPTNVEIEAVDARDAGMFLLALQADAPAAYDEFLDAHRPRHKDPDGSDFDPEGTELRALFQPVWLTIGHLIKLLVHTVEHNTSALKNEDNADGVIQQAEAAKFIKQRAQGQELAAGVAAERLAGADWRLAQDKAIFTAAAIRIQLASRARKAKRRVEERRGRTQAAAAQQLDEEAQHDRGVLSAAEVEASGQNPPLQRADAQSRADVLR